MLRLRLFHGTMGRDHGKCRDRDNHRDTNTDLSEVHNPDHTALAEFSGAEYSLVRAEEQMSAGVYFVSR